MSECRDYLLGSCMLGYIAAAKCDSDLATEEIQRVMKRLAAVRDEGRRMYISAITIG